MSVNVESMIIAFPMKTSVITAVFYCIVKHYHPPPMGTNTRHQEILVSVDNYMIFHYNPCIYIILYIILAVKA